MKQSGTNVLSAVNAAQAVRKVRRQQVGWVSPSIKNEIRRDGENRGSHPK